MEDYIALMGIEHHAGFWKTTPRELYALYEIKNGQTRAQMQTRALAAFTEGVD